VTTQDVLPTRHRRLQVRIGDRNDAKVAIHDEVRIGVCLKNSLKVRQGAVGGFHSLPSQFAKSRVHPAIGSVSGKRPVECYADVCSKVEIGRNHKRP
jgi:hypothetical protein